jgi:hypothetical protein
VSNTATLVYHATAVGPTVPANLAAAMTAVDLDFVEIETATGCTLVSDITTTVGSVVTRTIVFDTNTAAFAERFPAGSDQASPFTGLYTMALSGGLNCLIKEDPVLIA